MEEFMQSVNELNSLINMLLIVIGSGVGLRILFLALKGIITGEVDDIKAKAKNSVLFGIYSGMAVLIVKTLIFYFR